MATAKVIIAGQNNIGPAVKSAQGDITSLSNAAQKAGYASAVLGYGGSIRKEDNKFRLQRRFIVQE